MTLLAGVVVGFLAGRLVWMVTGPVLAVPALARANYRGRTVITGTGVVVPLAVALVEAGRALAGSLGIGDGTAATPRLLVLLAVSGFALLGLADDVGGSGAEQGFRGHLGALLRGRATTGLLKLVGGATLALVVVGAVDGDRPGRLVADAALVALCANLANLLDRRPGRSLKATITAFVVVAVATRGDPALVAVAVVVGAGLALLLDDLHEHVMLGDAGANALGAALGLGLVLTTAPATRTAALVAVAGLNLVGEALSFSRVIDAVPPLRALDRAGRRP